MWLYQKMGCLEKEKTQLAARCCRLGEIREFSAMSTANEHGPR
jgi:hypothetical protein